MLYLLLYRFKETFGVLNVTHYLSFRAIMGLFFSFFISLLCSPWFIKKLKIKKVGQVIREDGPKSHLSKAGVPTMGGSLIIAALSLSALLWVDWFNSTFWLCFLIFLGYGALGFMDDWNKLRRQHSRGVTPKQKLFFQCSLALLVMSVHYFFVTRDGNVYLPFFKDLSFDLGWGYIFFGAFVIVGTSNAVNLTDGLDGLAIAPAIITAACLGILAYISGNIKLAYYLNYTYFEGVGELAVFAGCLIGAGLGFLWYNTYPAQIFMGDVGSLSIGGALGAMAVFSKHELILPIIGGIFVLEAVSVITQVASFKLTGKRIFRMAPIHHHFELLGWPEPKVIVRFWIISIVLGLLGLLSIKLR